jgi:trimeric autotransporter adhesin
VRSTALAVALVALAATVRADPPPTLIGSTEDGRLLLFHADRPEAARAVRPSGLSGRIVGIDSRPADGLLYGLTTSNDLYRIDPATGASTLVSSLTVPFDRDVRSGIAFNPQADRLRLVGADGQNLRVNVVLGAMAVDTPLAYAPSDRNAGKRPRIAGAAYTNAVRDAPTTKLFEIDAEQDVLVLQDPPNDGVLTTVGPLDADFAPLSGFTIVTDTIGADHAYAATAGRLYTIDLTTGHATPVGTIGDPPAPLASLAAARGADAP